MMFKVLKHMKIAGKYTHSGNIFKLSVLDRVLDDGRLLYHYDDFRYQIIPKDSFRLVYSSYNELLELTGKNDEKKK